MRRLLECRTRGGRSRRRGAAIVEFAVVLPLLLLLLFGIIEFGWLFMVRQTLVNAAREGCRVAVLRTSTDADVATRIQEVMDPFGASGGGGWSYTASDIADAVQWVRVSMPFDAVALTGAYILPSGFELEGECSMRKEGGGI